MWVDVDVDLDVDLNRYPMGTAGSARQAGDLEPLTQTPGSTRERAGRRRE